MLNASGINNKTGTWKPFISLFYTKTLCITHRFVLSLAVALDVSTFSTFMTRMLCVILQTTSRWKPGFNWSLAVITFHTFLWADLFYLSCRDVLIHYSLTLHGLNGWNSSCHIIYRRDGHKQKILLPCLSQVTISSQKACRTGFSF